MERRDFLKGMMISIGLAAMGKMSSSNQFPPFLPEVAEAAEPPFKLQTVKALTFDVFGTVVDWRASIIREGQSLAERRGLQVDWAAFADAWRSGYMPAMDRVRRGEMPWTTIDGLHRMILDRLLEEFSITGLSEDEIEHLNRAWHRLTPWPDVIPGLTRMRKRYVLATLSNGNVSLLMNMAKNAGLPWDVILSSELARRYKPDKEVYLTAAELLDLDPAEIVMVAAHNLDLLAAKSVGFKGAFVPRPLEWGPDADPDITPDPSIEIVAEDFNDLADQLGA